MGTNEQIARLILQQTWEEREAMAGWLAFSAELIGEWARHVLDSEQPQPELAAQDDD